MKKTKWKWKWIVVSILLVLIGATGLYVYNFSGPPPHIRQVSCLTSIYTYFLLSGRFPEEIQKRSLEDKLPPENFDETPVESLNVIPHFNKSGHQLTLATDKAKPKSGKDIILFNRDYIDESAAWIVIIKGSDLKSRNKGCLTLLKDGSTKRTKDINQLIKQTDNIIYYIYEETK